MPNIKYIKSGTLLDFWFPCQLEGFHSVGHRVLYDKLLHHNCVDAAKTLIRSSHNPKTLATLARQALTSAEADLVSLWAHVAPAVELAAYLARADVDLRFSEALLSTGQDILAYVSASNAETGIGTHHDEPALWTRNTTGKVLMQARAVLEMQKDITHPHLLPDTLG